jgi:hypothetical protein
MIDPEPPRTRMIRSALRGSSSSSAHGLPGRIVSCVLDLLGRANPRARADSETTI